MKLETVLSTGLMWVRESLFCLILIKVLFKARHQIGSVAGINFFFCKSEHSFCKQLTFKLFFLDVFKKSNMFQVLIILWSNAIIQTLHSGKKLLYKVCFFPVFSLQVWNYLEFLIDWIEYVHHRCMAFIIRTFILFYLWSFFQIHLTCSFKCSSLVFGSEIHEIFTTEVGV